MFDVFFSFVSSFFFEFSLIPTMSPEFRPYRLAETDRSAPTGGLKLKNQNFIFGGFAIFIGFRCLLNRIEES